MIRFSQQDAHSPSMTLPVSLNEYLFTYNDPVSRIDANGLVLGDLGAEVPEELKGLKKPEVTNENFRRILNGTATDFSDWHGEQQSMTNDDWLEFSQVLAYLERVNRLIYGANRPEGETSARIDANGVLYSDCWGMTFVCGKALLAEDVF